MPGYFAVVVGYHKDDLVNRRRFQSDQLGGKCISCGRPTYFNPSGIKAIRERDAHVVCEGCKSRYKGFIISDL